MHVNILKGPAGERAKKPLYVHIVKAAAERRETFICVVQIFKTGAATQCKFNANIDLFPSESKICSHSTRQSRRMRSAHKYTFLCKACVYTHIRKQ
jgi:hypothetical protein